MRECPARRIAEALRTLRSQLPADAPLTGLTIAHAGDRVTVGDSSARREVGSGQFLFAFDVGGEHGEVRIVELPCAAAPPPPGPLESDDCEALFELALAHEDSDVDAAMAGYRRCVARDSHPGARVNLGRLLHQQGRIEDAVTEYLQVDSPDAVLLFNLGVAQEDLARHDEAAASYERAIALDPELADAHFNLARLRERAGDARAALRHWTAYRRLT